MCGQWRERNMRATFQFFGTTVLLLCSALLFFGCASSKSDFETFMGTPLPSNVQIIKTDGNWGNDPWRCWEISPADQDLARTLIAKWNLSPDAHAFPGVASEGKVYCRHDEMSAGYSANTDSYRAIGLDAKRNVLVVYFYNG